VTFATAPCGTSLASKRSDPGTTTSLQTLLFDSLMAAFRVMKEMGHHSGRMPVM